MTVQGFVCGPRIYKFGKWTFEFGYCGPWPLKKDGELRKKMGRKFLNDISEFLDLDDEEKKRYRIGGGCIPI